MSLVYIETKDADLNTSFFTTLAQMLKQNTTNRTFNQIVKETSLFLILWKKNPRVHLDQYYLHLAK